MSFKQYKEQKWTSSIFMPRNAARIFLEVTDVKLERLHNMKKGDFIKEGAKDKADFISRYIFLIAQKKRIFIKVIMNVKIVVQNLTGMKKKNLQNGWRNRL